MALNNWNSDKKEPREEQESLDIHESVDLLIERDNPMSEIAISLQEQL